ncbi:putative arsenite efflux transporter ArsB-like protein [Microdochium trichocladiopsis]|uniref:Arsenite efflux transporter ArsB-like protein n=1 Tax=Microdochium trichocladiopsis TaxID=1682393 RepID=A0A9P8Y207_9PEZI|nr:putative arsenite efflux transporter ArsB-like protein [Microdochium trichocladiopsis]KAH7026596.1 putative arsenite efflux transporter ArsB-like protein [Microdochium trichocladiopsis]
MANDNTSTASTAGGVSNIQEWRSIVTLVVFVVTNIIVLAPFHIPIPVPRSFNDAIRQFFVKARVIPPRREAPDQESTKPHKVVYWNIPINLITAPLVADLFLLAISAIGRQEVVDGTYGKDSIYPYDIMIFFISLAYIAISIDASGLIRYLAFKVLQKGGKVGPWLFFYLYTFFFALGSFIGNDPIILSGTAFLAYMTRVSRNIVHPRAWIFTQFAVANIASAILVSSNPTNLVLAGAFGIKFIVYTANMIVPVVVTAIVLFPFLLYVIFADEGLIPSSIQMHELSEEAKAKKPVNPNIPHGRGIEEDDDGMTNDDEAKQLSLEEVMNPFLDKHGAAFGAVIMAATLITVLVVNAAQIHGGHIQVYLITLPAAVVMLCWDLTLGWLNRKETRKISQRGREEIEHKRAEREAREAALQIAPPPTSSQQTSTEELRIPPPGDTAISQSEGTEALSTPSEKDVLAAANLREGSSNTEAEAEAEAAKEGQTQSSLPNPEKPTAVMGDTTPNELSGPSSEDAKRDVRTPSNTSEKASLVSKVEDGLSWARETFPTVMAVMSHLPFALIPFAFCMFVMVQGLVTKGWIEVFAYGWDHWVEKTGTIGSIGGMGFLGVILSNFSGTNIGTTILLCRVIQGWEKLHGDGLNPISDRTFWGAVYSMALGVNYGAFSIAFSASLAGLLWRDILARKHIHVRSLDFARVNLPIIAISMIVGCTVLVGEIYIIRTDNPYSKGT